MKHNLVAKFGGTSVKDAKAIRQVAEIVKHQQAKLRFVVVSAVAGVTNLLLEFCHTSPENRTTLMNQIKPKTS